MLQYDQISLQMFKILLLRLFWDNYCFWQLLETDTIHFIIRNSTYPRLKCRFLTWLGLLFTLGIKLFITNC